MRATVGHSQRRQMIEKASASDFEGRFREIIADPLNLLIARHPRAGTVADGMVVLHNGNEVPIDGPGAYYGAFSAILRLNRGVHEPLEEFAFQQMLRTLGQAPTILELGAYWAHYAMWLMRARPSGAAILVEPDPLHRSAGEANFRHNGFFGRFIGETVGAKGFGVDRFLDSFGDRRLDILHADIQGSEVAMLNGAARVLSARRIDHVFVSTHSQALHRTSCDILRGHGYRIELSADHDVETTSHDGFVFAVCPDRPRVYAGPAPLGRTAIATTDPHDSLRHLALVAAGSESGSGADADEIRRRLARTAPG